MKSASESLPTDLAAAHAMILAERQARLAAEAEAANAQADLSSSAALIAHLKLAIEKLRRTLYGPHAERKARLLDQLEIGSASCRERVCQSVSVSVVAVALKKHVNTIQTYRTK